MTLLTRSLTRWSYFSWNAGLQSLRFLLSSNQTKRMQQAMTNSVMQDNCMDMFEYEIFVGNFYCRILTGTRLVAEKSQWSKLNKTARLQRIL